MVSLPLLLALLIVGSDVAVAVLPTCSPVQTTIPADGILVVLGPVVVRPLTRIVFPDPFLQFPSIQTATNISLQFWLQIRPCPKVSCMYDPVTKTLVTITQADLLLGMRVQIQMTMISTVPKLNAVVFFKNVLLATATSAFVFPSPALMPIAGPYSVVLNIMLTQKTISLLIDSPEIPPTQASWAGPSPTSFGIGQIWLSDCAPERVGDTSNYYQYWAHNLRAFPGVTLGLSALTSPPLSLPAARFWRFLPPPVALNGSATAEGGNLLLTGPLQTMTNSLNLNLKLSLQNQNASVYGMVMQAWTVPIYSDYISLFVSMNTFPDGNRYAVLLSLHPDPMASRIPLSNRDTFPSIWVNATGMITLAILGAGSNAVPTIVPVNNVVLGATVQLILMVTLTSTNILTQLIMLDLHQKIIGGQNNVAARSYVPMSDVNIWLGNTQYTSDQAPDTINADAIISYVRRGLHLQGAGGLPLVTTTLGDASSVSNPVCVIGSDNETSMFPQVPCANPAAYVIPASANNYGQYQMCLECERSSSSGCICPTNTRPITDANLGEQTCIRCSPGSTALPGSSMCTICSKGQYATNAGKCDPCPPGFYNSLPAQTACQKCPMLMTPNTTLTGCTLCGDGKTAIPGDPACRDCPAMTYRLGMSGGDCLPCPYGQLSTPGSAQCKTCSPGYVANLVTYKCVQCRQGQVAIDFTLCGSCPDLSAPATNQASCVQCLSGYYSHSGDYVCKPCPEMTSRMAVAECVAVCQPDQLTDQCFDSSIGQVAEKGQSVCTSCKAGKYADLITAKCKACPATQYNDKKEQSTCSNCPANQEPGMNNTLCVQCPLGSFSTPGTLCEPCGVGMYGTSDGCFPCPDGKGTSNLASTKCTNCTKGRYSLKGECIPCAVGMFNKDEAQATCVNCSTGYVSTTDRTFCSPCGMGQYNTGPPMTTCRDCDVNSYASQKASPSCTMCPYGSITTGTGSIAHTSCLCNVGFYVSNHACLPCPQGGNCSSINTLVPGVRAGYYRDVTAPLRIVSCDPASACPAVAGNGSTMCADGYTGDRCSSCLSTHYRSSNACIGCGNNYISMVLMGLMLFLVSAAFMALAVPAATPYTAIGISLTHIQLIAVFGTTTNVPWSPSVKQTFDMMSLLNFNLDLFHMECNMKVVYWKKQELKFLLPAMCIGIVTVLLAFMAAKDVRERRVQKTMRAKLAASGGSAPPKTTDWSVSLPKLDRAVFASVLVLQHGYTLLVSTATNTFNCNAVTGTTSNEAYIQSDSSISCTDDAYFERLPSVWGAFVLYGIGVPATFALVLLYHYRHGTLESEHFRNRYNALTAAYQPGYFWWEIVSMVRRLCLILAINLVSDPMLKLFYALSILSASLVLQVFCNPYRTTEENHLANLWNIVTVNVLFSAAVLSAGTISTNAASTLAVMLFVCFAGTIVFSLYCLALEYAVRKQEAIELDVVATPSHSQNVLPPESTMATINVPSYFAPASTSLSPLPSMTPSSTSSLKQGMSMRSMLRPVSDNTPLASGSYQPVSLRRAAANTKARPKKTDRLELNYDMEPEDPESSKDGFWRKSYQ